MERGVIKVVEELIEIGDYQRALSLLTDLQDENVRYLRLVCLVALEQYHQAKDEGLYAKMNAKETYYDVISLYVTTLKELQEYEEAINILIEELSMPYIPYQYETMFNAAYDEILLDKQETNWQIESKNQIFSIEEIEQILKNKQTNEDLLYMALDQLQQLNIRMIIPTIKDYLMDPQRHFFAKTLLLEILIEQQVDDEIQLEKFGQYYDINPSFSPLVLQQIAYEGIIKYLQNGLEDENPTLFQQCVEFLEYVLYAIYPKEIYEDEFHIKAAAIHYYVATLLAIDMDIEDIEMMYYCDKYDIENEILALKAIEC